MPPGEEWNSGDYYHYFVKVNGSGRLTIRNHRFLRKSNPPGCKSRSSIPYLRKADIPLQKLVFSSNDEVIDSKQNFDILRFQKGIFFNAEITIAIFATQN